MFVKPSSAFVGEALARRQLLGQREERAVGEVVAVDEEELGVAGGRVVELQLLSGQRLGHRKLNGIVLRRCRASRFSRSPTSISARRPSCSPNAIADTVRRSRSSPSQRTTGPRWRRCGAANRPRASSDCGTGRLPATCSASARTTGRGGRTSGSTRRGMRWIRLKISATSTPLRRWTGWSRAERDTTRLLLRPTPRCSRRGIG